MGLPKNFKNDLKINKQPEGIDKRWEMVDDIDSNLGYLPRGISHEDLDKSFIDYIKDDLDVIVEGVKVPVYILSIQRWSEFYKTWQNTDEYGNLKLPFIVITRKLDVQRGTTHAQNYNIPGFPTWTYVKVPVSDGIRNGHDIYKIPQPIAVDISYDVRFFCEKIRHLNILNRKILRDFSARQRYINVNGHPMPVHLETIGDESQVDTIESRRFYVQPYDMKLLGYLLVEEDFEVVPTVNRTLFISEISDKISKGVIMTRPTIPPSTGQEIKLTLEFIDLSPFYIVDITYPMVINSVDTVNVTSYSYLLNGSTVSSLPFSVVVGDKLRVSIIKINTSISGIITFNGVI